MTPPRAKELAIPRGKHSPCQRRSTSTSCESTRLCRSSERGWVSRVLRCCLLSYFCGARRPMCLGLSTAGSCPPVLMIRRAACDLPSRVPCSARSCVQCVCGRVGAGRCVLVRARAWGSDYRSCCSERCEQAYGIVWKAIDKKTRYMSIPLFASRTA